MKKIVFMVFLLSVFASRATWASSHTLEAVKQKFSKEALEKNDEIWGTCSDSSECVVIQGACDLTCVNKKFKQEADSYYHEYGTMISCVEVQHETLPLPICRQARCTCDYFDKDATQTRQWVPDGFKEEWSSCSVNPDCRVEPLPCSGAWIAVNKQSTENFLNKFGTPENTNCTGDSQIGPPPVAVCIDKICQATDKSKMEYP